ncbi:hypothetical protein [Pontibacter sp. BAB1700]|uniref:hypothetical protein n=1 Tax=Pontibacter sp. BAB1700 TaxID=1144253 RepID=UPI00350F7D46
MRELNLPPTWRSFSARGVCQSSEALFHLVMCWGSVQNCHTFSTGACMLAPIVMGLFLLCFP